MREKKYANLLLEDEEKEKLKHFSKQDDMEIDGAKLSMTRELKFKKLQEELEKDEKIELSEDLEKELNDDYDLTDTSERELIKKRFEAFVDSPEEATGPTIEDRDSKDELMMPKIKGEKRIVGAYAKKEEKVEPSKIQEYNEDELYLTTSFKPLRKRFKMSKLVKTILFIIVLIGTGLALYFFGIKPLFDLYSNSKPQMIYSNTIDSISNTLLEYTDVLIPYQDNMYMDMKYTINNDGNNYGFVMGLDKDKSNKEFSYYVDNNKRYGVRILENKGVSYTNYIGTYVYLEENPEDQFYTKYKKLINDSVIIGRDDMKYVITKMTEIIKKSIDPENIDHANDELDVHGETIKVVRNTLTINHETFNMMGRRIYDGITDDTKLIKLLADINGMSEKDYLKELDKLTQPMEDKIYINIYTVKGNEVVGIDVEKNGFRNIYWYKDNKGNFDAYLNITEDNCEDIGTECGEKEVRIISINGTAIDNGTKVVVNYNSKEYGTFVIRSLTKDRIDGDFNITYYDTKYVGNILMHLNTNTYRYDGDININNDKISFILDFNNKKVADMNSATIMPYAKETYDRETDMYIKDIDNQNIVDGINISKEKFYKILDDLM